MADLEKSVRTRLLAHAGVSDLVQAGQRVYYGELPKDPTLPAITIQEIVSVPEGAMGEDCGIALATIQVDAWAETRQEAKDLGEQVRDALQRYHGTHDSSELTFVGMTGAGPRRDPPGSRTWRHQQDFEVWFTEAVA